MIDTLLTPRNVAFAVDTSIGFGLAGVLAIAIGYLAQRRSSVWLLTLLWVSLITLVLTDTGQRLFAIHGAMHTSIVYSIFERGVPPEMPLVAGENLQYVYTFHYIVAQMMKRIALAPPWFFAALDVVSIAAMTLILDRLASAVLPDRRYRIIAIVLILVGFTPLLSTPVGAVLNELFRLPEESSIDILHKFTTTNNNQIGIVFFTLGFLGFVNLILGKCKRSSYLPIVISYIGIGLFYPPLLVGFGVVSFAAVLHLMLVGQPARMAQAFTVIAITAIGGIVLLPWLIMISGDRVGSGAIRLISGAALPRNAYILLALAAVPALVGVFHRDSLMREWTRNKPLLTFLVLSMVGLQFAFLLSIGSHSSSLELKTLTLSQIPLGLLAGLIFRDVMEKRYVVFLGLLTILTVPIGYKLGPVLAFDAPMADPAATSGVSYIHNDPLQNEIYSWILENTASNSIFVDNYLTIPVFSRRALYVGVDYRRESGLLTGNDGWSNTAAHTIEVTNGISNDVLEPRRDIVAEILSNEPGPLNAQVFDIMRHQFPRRPICIVARDPHVITRLKAVPLGTLTVEFENDSATIFSLAPAH